MGGWKWPQTGFDPGTGEIRDRHGGGRRIPEHTMSNNHVRHCFNTSQAFVFDPAFMRWEGITLCVVLVKSWF